MHLVETVGGHKVEAIIEPVTTTDFRTIKKSKRFPDFNWDKETINEKKNKTHRQRTCSVSYTHLTLPTSDLV